jgi:hypothetical protein
MIKSIQEKAMMKRSNSSNLLVGAGVVLLLAHFIVRLFESGAVWPITTATLSVACFALYYIIEGGKYD